MPSRTVFIDVVTDGEKVDAYSVSLTSSDGSYGIKEVESSVITISSGTQPSNPSTGRYEYTFNAENYKEYAVSWRVKLSSDSDYTYTLQNIGPITVDENNVHAVTDFRGRFLQDSVGTFILRVTDFDGDPIDASEITYEILDSDNISQVSDIPEKIDTGAYAFRWDIESDQPTGEYSLIWLYTVGGVRRREEHQFIVSTNVDTGSDAGYYSGRIMEFREALSQMISCAQHVPIYFQQAQSSRDRLTYRWTKQMWNQSLGTKIYRNKEIINFGYEINYRKGIVKFDNPLTEYDMIHADYNFRWFSDEQLDRFISNALHTVNIFPTESNYNIMTVPEKFIPVILYGAAKDALRNLMLCIQYPEPAELFGGPERAQQVFGNMETLKQNYHKDWELLLQQKKLGRYPRGTNIVIPEFTLPGGRSRWFRYLFSGSGSSG